MLSKSKLIGIFTAIIIVGLILTSVQHTKKRFLAQFDQLVESQIQSGILITYKDKFISGWPWALHLTLKEVQLYGQSVVGWKIPRLEEIIISYSPLQTETLAFKISSPFQVLFDVTQIPRVIIDQLDGEISTIDPLKIYSFDFKNIQLEQVQKAWIQASYLHLESAAVKAEPKSEMLIDGMKIEIHDLTGIPLPFSKIQLMGGRLAFSQPFEAGDLPHMLQSWFKNGGSLELTDFVFKADQFDMQGAATFSLDETLQPLIVCTARMMGIQETIDDMTKNQTITATTARALKLSLAFALMATQSQDFKMNFQGKSDSVQSLNLSFTVQNGAVYIGSHKITTFPKINWQAFKTKT